jgi:hypothetical protein
VVPETAAKVETEAKAATVAMLGKVETAAVAAMAVGFGFRIRRTPAAMLP